MNKKLRAGKQEEIDLEVMSIAMVTAYMMSKDSTVAGAVVSTPDYRAFSTGYNGFGRGVVQTPERMQRPEKYQWTKHAEDNALLNAPFDTNGCDIHVTMQPCHPCAISILNAGIKRLVYYGYHPIYADGKWPSTRQDIFDEAVSQIDEVIVIPKNEFLENLRETLNQHRGNTFEYYKS